MDSEDLTERPQGPSWRNVPRNVWVLSLASFLRDVASEMLFHLLPLFLANVLGVRLGVIGLIEGAAETISSLTKIASGWLSDRLARRKGLTVAGYGLAAVASVLLALARGWPGVLVARSLDRFGKGVRTAPRDALLADSVADDRRGAGFGLHRAADTAGALVGLLLAMAIVWRLQQDGLTLGEGTFRTVAMWAVVPAVLAALVVAFGVTEARRAPAAEPGGRPRTDAPLAPAFKRFVFVMILFTLGNSSDAFLVLRAQSIGASVLGVLAMLAAFNLVYAALAGPAGALSDRLDRRTLIVAGWLLYAGVYVGFAGAESVWMLWLLYIAYGVYYALTEGVAKAFVADLVPSERRGTAYGLYNGAIGITALPASVIAGVLWQGVGAWAGLGPWAPFAFGAVLAVAASVLLWRWV